MLQLKKNYNNISIKNKIKLIEEIYLSHKDYYNCFSKSKKKIFKIIEIFLKSRKSDISNYYLIFFQKKFAGFISFFSCDQYNKRLFNNLILIQKILNKNDFNLALRKLRKFHKNFNQVSNHKKKYYLSRILIFKNFRKKKIGTQTIKKVFKNKNFLLHVKKNNVIAIIFYKKNLFKIIKSDKKYLLLGKELANK